MEKISHPILSCADAKRLEAALLGDSDNASFAAMQKAGTGVAREFLREFGPRLPYSPKLLAFVGSGHNGGDALIALSSIAEKSASPKITVICGDTAKMKPNTKKALNALAKKFPELEIGREIDTAREFDLAIDGILGMSFTPPLRESAAEKIRAANTVRAGIKISIDIPSGAADTPQECVFRADATYATGIAKDVLFKPHNRECAGRIRYVDIGFFDAPTEFDGAAIRIARPDILRFANTLRPAISDKRTFGHLFIVAGSRKYPGAAMLATRAALRAGAGLVSSFVPESLAPAFAAAEPSAIWVGCPEDESGAIALDALGLVRDRLGAASALLAGCGLSDSPETQALVGEILRLNPALPAVLDADAIREPIVKILPSRNAPALLTPHEGEILRLAPDASDASLLDACKKYECAIALKSAATRISDGKTIIMQTRGCPALARGGSGDMLAGISGALLANKSLKSDAIAAGTQASMWLGLAAETASTELGETALATSDLPHYLPRALLTHR